MFPWRRQEFFAGLAIHTDSLRYIELKREAGELIEIRREIISLLPGCTVRGAISRFDLLDRAFYTLSERLRRFDCPVALGLPPWHTMPKLIDYPAMSLGEALGALNLEFKEHFPWSRSRAVLETAMIDAPLADSRMAILAVAAQLECVNRLLWTSKRAGIPVDVLEPVNMAFSRAISGERVPEKDCLILALEPELHSLTLIHHGNGILFRFIVNNLNDETDLNQKEAINNLVEDIRATLTFAGNRFRQIEVRHLLIGGSLVPGEPLKNALEEQTSLKVLLPNVGKDWQIHEARCVQGFEAAVGLALRRAVKKTSPVCFDLRPAEYIEQERRRHIFSAVRLTSSLLALMFVLSCGGYIALALRELYCVSSEIVRRQEELTHLEARQKALTADISRLREREEKMTKTLRAMGQEIPVLEVMNCLEQLSGPEVRFITVRFTHSGGEDEKDACAVIVDGETSTSAVPALMERLGEEGFFRNVEMLNSVQTGDETTTFSLLLTTGLQGSALHEERGDGGK
ncbi:MAG: hypothetical protein K5841_01575 [Fretibacterium sp.]|nr:hypothetical protein [Fretibacterium sp.]